MKLKARHPQPYRILNDLDGFVNMLRNDGDIAEEYLPVFMKWDNNDDDSNDED